jgi:TPR repeat protein
MDDAEVLDCFGQIFQFTLGANSDLGKTAQLFNKAADAAHVRAMCHYGDLLEEGRAVREDIPEGVRYLRSAVDTCLTQDHIDRNPADRVPEATYALCELLQYGDEDVKPHFEWVAIWVQQSPEQGQSLAMIK